MGARAARATGVLLLVGLLVLLLTGGPWRTTVSALDGSFAVRDALTPAGVARPGTALRSGGPDSLVSWTPSAGRGACSPVAARRPTTSPR